MIAFLTAAAWRDADGLVGHHAFKAVLYEMQEIFKMCTSQGCLMSLGYPNWAKKLPGHVINALGRQNDEHGKDVAGFRQIDFLYAAHQKNDYYKGKKLTSPSALFDVANIDVFKGESEVDRGDNETIARLYVKRLEALLHLCAVDTAAMADINAVLLRDIYDKLRGL